MYQFVSPPHKSLHQDGAYLLDAISVGRVRSAAAATLLRALAVAAVAAATVVTAATADNVPKTRPPASAPGRAGSFRVLLSGRHGDAQSLLCPAAPPLPHRSERRACLPV
eukprot:scaffold6821_cov66-Phaeocystis_antarctica.AAC.7